jgi:predicted Zn-dependent protease
MKKIFSFFVIVSLFISCTQNMVTGRNQLSLVSEPELQSMGRQEYQIFLSANKVVNAGSNRDAEMVQRVGSRIAAAIKTYYDGKGQTSVLEGYQWEFNLVDNKEVNAWCMPGGKVVVLVRAAQRRKFQ